MATTPGKMQENDTNLTNLENKAGDTLGTGDASDMGKAEDLNRNWNREQKADASSANVSNISEGRRPEGWSAQVQQGASQIADKVRDFAGDFGTQAKDFASDAGKRVQDLASNAADRTSSAIREYPLQSLLVGFGVGCLVGFLIPRR